MDRQIVYVGAVPLDTDQLLQARNTMIAIGYLAKMVVGDSSIYADGLNCTPGGGLSVTMAPGSMTMPSTIDAGHFGALPPDSDPLVKIGINTGYTTVAFSGSGSLVVSGCVVETDAGSTAVAYYNVNDPAVTLFGAQGNGVAQATVSQQRVAFAVTAASALPVGYVPLWQLTVPAGALEITSPMISALANSAFIPVKLPAAAPIMSPAFTGNPTAPTSSAGDATSAIATTAFVAGAVARNRTAWGTAGSYSWTCPSGVSSVSIRAWAAGGSGGGSGAGYPGGGGGGGGYVEALVGVTAGTVYTVLVGGSTNGNSSTSFDNEVVVSGGLSGATGSSGQPGIGGLGGTLTTNNINSIALTGVGPGQGSYQIGNVSIGGAGGGSFGVTSGAPCINGAGAPGIWPGGGGAGGGTGGGGKGADGLLILDWNG